MKLPEPRAHGTLACCVCAAVALSCLATRSMATCTNELWVDVTCDATPDGTEAHPYCDLESAVAGDAEACSSHSVTVWVKPGDYYPGNVVKFSGLRDITLVSTDGRDATTIHRNLQLGNGDTSDVLDGFTVEPAFSGANRIDSYGIAIADAGGHATVRNCRVTGHGQRGLDLGNGTAVIEDTQIEGNAGGVQIHDADVTLRRCDVNSNEVFYSPEPPELNYDGGGLVILNDETHDVLIVDSTVNSNSAADGNGGGIWVHGTGTVRIVNTEISGNVAGGVSGGVGLSSPSGTSTSMASERVVCEQILLKTSMQNCLVTCNRAYRGGGLYLVYNADAEVVNTTITQNEGTIQGGGDVTATHSCLKLKNCIVCDNTGDPLFDTSVDSDIDVAASFVPTIAHGGTLCPGDVGFADPGGSGGACSGDEDFRLSAASLAVDSGINTYVLPDYGDLDNDANYGETTPLDLDLCNRFVGPVDLGPYELHVCESLVVPEVGPAGNRYITFDLPTSGDPDCALEAIRVTPVTFDGNSISEGQALWVGEPYDAPDEDLSEPGLTFRVAALDCEPVVRDWSDTPTVSVYGGEIIPGSSYLVQRVDYSEEDGDLVDRYCGVPGVIINTAKFGDIVAPFDGSGSVQPDFADIDGAVAKFLENPGAPRKRVCQIRPETVEPDQLVGFDDISAVVDAYNGIQYSATARAGGPCSCPSQVTCGATACTYDAQCVDGLCISGYCRDLCGRCSSP